MSIQAITVPERASARPIEDLALALARDLGDPQTLALALNNVAASLPIDDPGPILALLRESLALRRALGHPVWIALTLSNVAEVALVAGDRATALEHADEALALAREIGYREMITASGGTRGIIALEDGDLAKASERFGETLRIGREMGGRPPIVDGLLGLAGVAAVCGRDPDAIRLWEAARAIGTPQSDAYAVVERRHIEPVRQRLGDERRGALEAEGRAMTREQAIYLGLAIAADTRA